MNAALYGSVVVTLFVIMDPIGIIPVFLALVGRRPAPEAHRLAWQAALTSLLVISGFAVFGDAILSYLHISLPALRVAGGLLLLVVALQLLMRGEIQSAATADNANIALVPLGTPCWRDPVPSSRRSCSCATRRARSTCWPSERASSPST